MLMLIISPPPTRRPLELARSSDSDPEEDNVTAPTGRHIDIHIWHSRCLLFQLSKQHRFTDDGILDYVDWVSHTSFFRSEKLVPLALLRPYCSSTPLLELLSSYQRQFLLELTSLLSCPFSYLPHFLFKDAPLTPPLPPPR